VIVAQVTKFRRAACATRLNLNNKIIVDLGVGFNLGRSLTGHFPHYSRLKMIKFTIHVEFGQFGKTTDAFALDHDLRDCARTIRDNGKLLHCLAIKIDANFVVTDTPFIEKRFGLNANWTSAGAVYLDDIHWVSWISLI